jgi:uncharacterized protein
MSRVAYIDSSALLKMAFQEPENSAVEADLAQRDGLVASTLVALECRRAARRHSNRRAAQAVEEMLEAVWLVEITPAILDRAASVNPPLVRSLDAIHVATALSIAEPGLEIITYDGRMAAAALASGLRVVQPGR